MSDVFEGSTAANASGDWQIPAEAHLAPVPYFAVLKIGDAVSVLHVPIDTR